MEGGNHTAYGFLNCIALALAEFYYESTEIRKHENPKTIVEAIDIICFELQVMEILRCVLIGKKN